MTQNPMKDKEYMCEGTQHIHQSYRLVSIQAVLVGISMLKIIFWIPCCCVG
eukprot:m.22065 g.22065  ORF g.22065 m.22065 type:complete len:51 (+) comp12608_c0_seq3:638-790(+)